MSNQYPEPKFKIGDTVRVKTEAETDPDMIAVVNGLKLEFFDYMRRHIWYVHITDRQYEYEVSFREDELEAVEAETDSQKWYVSGGNVPIRAMVICWQCKKPRIDDSLDCPYCSAEDEDVARTDDIDDKVAACAIARDLGLDDVVRTVAQSGQNHDNGPNWYAVWEDMDISATFGAGTNSATVRFDEQILYQADEYGRHIKTFRYGPWVHRLEARAEELRQLNKIKRQQAEEATARRVLENFREVLF
jgi:hypothetical protein